MYSRCPSQTSTALCEPGGAASVHSLTKACTAGQEPPHLGQSFCSTEDCAGRWCGSWAASRS